MEKVRQTGRQAGRQAGRQTYRQAGSILSLPKLTKDNHKDEVKGRDPAPRVGVLALIKIVREYWVSPRIFVTAEHIHSHDVSPVIDKLQTIDCEHR